MHTEYLSLVNCINGTINGLLDKVFSPNIPTPPLEVKGYSYVGTTATRMMRSASRAGIYKKSGKKFFIKQLRYIRKHLDYRYLRNEVHLLDLLNARETKADRVRTPKLIEARHGKGHLCIITAYEEGQTLLDASAGKTIATLADIILHLRRLTMRFPITPGKHIGVRPPILTILTFPWYAIRAGLAEPKNLRTMLRGMRLFYAHSHRLLIGKDELGFVHRDLNRTNILYRNNRIIYTDCECMVWGDRLYDVALIPRMYADRISGNDYLRLMKKLRLTRDEQLRLIPLAISACLIKIATGNRSEMSYKNAILALPLLIDDIAPKLVAEQPFWKIPHTFISSFVRDIDLIIHTPIDYIQTCFDPIDPRIRVTPYNPRLTAAGRALVARITKHSPEIPVRFVGSAALRLCGISNDIDLLVPCDTKQERASVTKSLTAQFGEPVITNKRFSKWHTKSEGYEADILVGYRTGRMMADLLHANTLLARHADIRRAYDEFKKASHGSSFREYQKNKLYFFTTAGRYQNHL